MSGTELGVTVQTYDHRGRPVTISVLPSPGREYLSVTVDDLHLTVSREEAEALVLALSAAWKEAQ